VTVRAVSCLVATVLRLNQGVTYVLFLLVSLLSFIAAAVSEVRAKPRRTFSPRRTITHACPNANHGGNKSSPSFSPRRLPSTLTNTPCSIVVGFLIDPCVCARIYVPLFAVSGSISVIVSKYPRECILRTLLCSIANDMVLVDIILNDGRAPLIYNNILSKLHNPTQHTHESMCHICACSVVSIAVQAYR
jgi:hypothetical protein